MYRSGDRPDPVTISELHLLWTAQWTRIPRSGRCPCPGHATDDVTLEATQGEVRRVTARTQCAAVLEVGVYAQRMASLWSHRSTTTTYTTCPDVKQTIDHTVWRVEPQSRGNGHWRAISSAPRKLKHVVGTTLWFQRPTKRPTECPTADGTAVG